MIGELVLSFRPSVSITEVAPDQRVLAAPGIEVTLKRVTPGVAAVLQVLSSSGATEDALGRLVAEAEGHGDLSAFYYRLYQWRALGLLRVTLRDNGDPVATVAPMTAGFRLTPAAIDIDARCCLSRFAYCRRAGDEMVVESPLSLAKTILHDARVLAIVGTLARPRSASDLCAIHRDLAPETIQAFTGLLVDTGIVTVVNDNNELPEDTDITLKGWEFHDLMFHTRSRRGRHDYPFGATFSGADISDPLPAVKPPMTDHGITLARPDPETVMAHDPPLAAALEQRRSHREHGAQPITIRQLGEFLYRSARVREIIDPNPAPGAAYQFCSRPYPSGGGVYDLELYLTVGCCTDLESGIYHYEPLGHRLNKITDRDGNVELLLREARAAAGMPVDPHILVTLTSRFQRLSWKYSSLAYALALKNVGALFQTMYLVATAMDIAACALGGGDSELFAKATGVDRFAEPSVGEFILGSLPEPHRAGRGS